MLKNPSVGEPAAQLGVNSNKLAKDTEGKWELRGGVRFACVVQVMALDLNHRVSAEVSGPCFLRTRPDTHG